MILVKGRWSGPFLKKNIYIYITHKKIIFWFHANKIPSPTKTIQSGNPDVLLKKGHIPVRRKRCCLLQKIKIPRAARETSDETGTKNTRPAHPPGGILALPVHLIPEKCFKVLHDPTRMRHYAQEYSPDYPAGVILSTYLNCTFRALGPILLKNDYDQSFPKVQSAPNSR